MKCPRCRHENLPTAKFCQECAAPLLRACVNCGSALPDSAKFCPQCAHPVDPTASASAPDPSTADGERRQATILFADISDYTQLCASLDAEQVQTLLNRFYAVTDRTVATYGGSVIDHAGDGLLAVFGAPVAHGNDPERAVRAALEMHAEGAQVSAPDGRPLALHIGIASGEVVAAVLSGGATPKYTVTGDTVNLAARLNALANAGDTVLSQSTYETVASLVATTNLGERSVKGFEAPVRVYGVRALRHGVTDRLPFVGRQAELRQLMGVLDSTRESRSGVAVAIRGDPGIGKSRLVEEMLRCAETQGFTCHIARVLDFGVAKTQEPLPTTVAAMLGLPVGAPDPIKRAELARALKTKLIEAEHEVLVCDLLGLEQREEQQSIFDAMDDAIRRRRAAQAVADLAAGVANNQPRIFVFEDIHWASPLLLDCLAALGAAAQACPLILLMTTRLEGDPLDRGWRAATQGTPLLTIDLGPLRAEEARVLAGGVVETSNRFALECIERAEGNPLFLEQLLRNARESGGDIVPPTVQSLVLARLDRLPPNEKLALQVASVLGKRFLLDALRVVIGNDNYRCDALVAADLVRSDSGGAYLFAHALIQEGVYSSLLNSRKRLFHGHAAEFYRGQEPTLYAQHLDRAQDPAAAQAYLVAGKLEADSFHYDVALRLADRGWKLAESSELRCELGLLRGDLLREMARTHDAIDAFEQALKETRNDEQRCRALIDLATGHRITGAVAVAMEALDQALPIALREKMWSTCSRIHNMRGNLHFAQGEVAACGVEHQRALEYALQVHDVEREALAWSGLGDHCYAEGRMITALGHFRRCIQLCRQLGLVRAEIPNLCMVGHCLSMNGEVRAALQEIHSAIALARRIGLAQAEVMTLESIAFALVLFKGAYDEAAPWLEQAIGVARQAGARRYLATNYLLMAACRRAQGRLDEARALTEEAYELGSQIGMLFLGPRLLAAKAFVARDPGERQQLLSEGEVMLSTGSFGIGALLFYREAIDISIEHESWDEALRFANALESFVQSEPLAFSTLVVSRATTLVALARDGRTPAVVAELAAVRERLLQAGIEALVPLIDRALAV